MREIGRSAAGSGSFTVTKDGKAVTVLKVGARVGADAKDPSKSVVHVVAQLGAKENLTAVFSIAPADFAAGKTVTLTGKGGTLSGYLLLADGGYTPLSGGSLTLTKASTTASAAVKGTFTATWSAGKGK